MRTPHLLGNIAADDIEMNLPGNPVAEFASYYGQPSVFVQY
jgi:hypothetical protein